MAVRTTNDGTGGPTVGAAFMAEYAGHIDTLYDASALPLITIAGTANAVTAVVQPVLLSGLVAGMAFWFRPTSNNSGTMTLKIGSEAAKAIVGADGSALATGDVLTTTQYLLYYDGTQFRIVSTAGAIQDGADLTYDVFTSSGTLTKPAGFPDDGAVILEAWGGGGGGGGSGAGGGGGYNFKVLRGADLGATETVTIGAGGATSTAGGNTSIGSLLLAFGGGRGGGGKGGGGGGQQSAGGSGSGTPTGGSPSPGAAGSGGPGGHGNSGGGGDGGAGGDGIFGGGGGGDSTHGGDSLYGGGGGATGGSGVGGTSSFGGDGGANTVAGTIPGGGGGGNAVGARGEVRVRWIG